MFFDQNKQLFVSIRLNFRMLFKYLLSFIVFTSVESRDFTEAMNLGQKLFAWGDPNRILLSDRKELMSLCEAYFGALAHDHFKDHIIERLRHNTETQQMAQKLIKDFDDPKLCKLFNESINDVIASNLKLNHYRERLIPIRNRLQHLLVEGAKNTTNLNINQFVCFANKINEEVLTIFPNKTIEQVRIEMYGPYYKFIEKYNTEKQCDRSLLPRASKEDMELRGVVLLLLEAISNLLEKQFNKNIGTTKPP